MKLLILGFSSLARRRITPAVIPLGWEVTIATRREAARSEIEALGARPIVGFDAGLRERVDLVYVATDNADHEHWVMAAIAAGHHVVVDKPSVLSVGAAEAAVAAAEQRGVCLAEATVYDRHPQLDALLALAHDRPAAYLRLHATFVVPAFKGDNFRNRRERGGGAVFDLGPYAASLIRRVYGAAPRALSVVHDHQLGPEAIDTGFALAADFGPRGVFTGQFAFGGEYANRLWLNAEGLQVDVDRVFTIPPQQPGKLTVRERDATREVETAPCDSFARFMTEVANAISNRTFARYAADLLFDARQVAALRSS